MNRKTPTMKILYVIALFLLAACQKSQPSGNGSYCWHCVSIGANPVLTKDTCSQTSHLGQFNWVDANGNDLGYSCYPK